MRPSNDLPGVPAAENLAERFTVLLRAPGRRITVCEPNVVQIVADHDVHPACRAACGILGVTASYVQGRELTVTLLRIS